jgi:hypothetical protein
MGNAQLLARITLPLLAPGFRAMFTAWACCLWTAFRADARQ